MILLKFFRKSDHKLDQPILNSDESFKQMLKENPKLLKSFLLEPEKILLRFDIKLDNAEITRVYADAFSIFYTISPESP